MFNLKKDKIEYFAFKVEGDKATYKVPKLQYMPMDLALEAKELENAEDEQAMMFVKNLFDAYAPGVCGGLTANEFGELATAYFEASGVAMGE